ncbi:LysR family transcriptional regulator [Morganella psychrotolerans]|uniref:LysR family transcriptional regulator n=1 Tax=Morganella psychrotolerans TaxID=368603 RepID=A0A1B8HQ94_9GAMM|nr:LysR family transcriptional regulator [Morganella psychrotolerans]OBU11384.1 LysR family transcriptional regulator [Morganella psychrotolerans]
MFFSRQLTQFFAIAENASLAEAAAQLNLTPSALSHGIRELECKTGISLIKRTGQKTSLTIAGTHLYEQLLPHYIKMTEIKDKLYEHKNNKLSINIKIDELYYTPLREKIISFCKGKNNLSLSLTSEKFLDIEKEIILNDTDIVISSAGIKNNSKIKCINLPSESIGLIIHNDLLSKYNSLQSLIENERIIQRKYEINGSVFNEFLNKFKKNNCCCNSICVSEASDISEFISSALGYSLIAENKAFIADMKNKNCSFIPLTLPCNMIINRQVYFRRNCNNIITELILKISELNN